MNPGLLNQRIRIERAGAGADALGQPTEAWELVLSVAARRMRDKAADEAVIADRDTEKRTIRFRVRSRPFTQIYEPGDRLVEAKRTDQPETIWNITGWTEVDGTNGMYTDILCAAPAR
ncbi:head-tail adaptor protein [Luteolibacter soli]|uniref:Head-tail adaptor protein n=1 Tax=Luteolibacter soli TaxID=3135280 RepID=A0ABU9AYM2_9BACT